MEVSSPDYGTITWPCLHAEWCPVERNTNHSNRQHDKQNNTIGVAFMTTLYIFAGDGSVDFIPDYLMEVSSPDYGTNTAREWFDLEDTNGDGFVTRDELINIATNVGMSREEAEQTAIGYYMSADQNGDGKLSWKGMLVNFILDT